MNGAQLKEALHGGRRVYGTLVVSTSPQWPPMIASVGLDFVFIDTEHIPIDRAQLGWMCRAYAGCGLAPIVRIPKPDPYLACMALDAGATGIVAPYVETPEEARQVSAAVNLRPLKGEILRKVLDGAETLDEETSAYLAAHNRSNLCILNVESVPAIDALDRILTVPGVDALLIGPHDLSISLGIPERYSDARFTEAVGLIVSRARAAGIGAGYHYSFGIREPVEWAKMGANLIIYSSDYFLVRDALKKDLAKLKSEIGDAATPGAPGREQNGMVNV